MTPNDQCPALFARAGQFAGDVSLKDRVVTSPFRSGQAGCAEHCQRPGRPGLVELGLACPPVAACRSGRQWGQAFLGSR